STLSKVPETRRRVVNSLRQQAAEVDAVGRQQTASPGPLSIRKRSLDDALTIIENATHGKGAHVIAPAGELLLLACGNLFLGKKNDDFHVAAFSEGCGDCATGISGSGHDNRSSSRHARDASRQKACGDLIECRGST